ncbi:FxsB family cyclophane-forming radical SAM/SPASM peptide maturase [Plantactinospora sp. B6F1]|uniref:FxsB family cyclophane-forming radical SAM/SPASM peptide maturase n=1 Tax=Plantactinospora sp. B6F1 TaxID=3158971 RepID=UPI00102D1D84
MNQQEAERSAVDPDEWPTMEVVKQALADPHWRPVPFYQFIIKLHGRCNLSCDYCYMYELADQSWRGKPVAMTQETIDQAARRIGEHIRAHNELSRVEVILHGGEPLLAGPSTLAYAATAFRNAATARSPVTLTMQTNGVLLDDNVLPVLREHHIRVGVSVDGDREGHDRHRRYADGRGSYDLVMRGLERLRRPAYRDLFAGVLCTVDTANDPIDVYEALLACSPPMINFLLPHGNWNEPPPGRGEDPGSTPHADWLIQIFDRWYDTAPPPTRIFLFEEIMTLILGGTGRSETVGLGAAGIIVIETDGTFELVDSLKSSFEGAPATGLDIFNNSLDDALLHPGVVARQRGSAALCDTCLACPIHKICGGGYYPHRYRVGSGFLNPSVYCADLTRLIGHIGQRMARDIEALKERTSDANTAAAAR